MNGQSATGEIVDRGYDFIFNDTAADRKTRIRDRNLSVTQTKVPFMPAPLRPMIAQQQQPQFNTKILLHSEFQRL